MRGGDRKPQDLGIGPWQGLTWRAVVVLGAAGVTVTVAALAAEALPQGDVRFEGMVRGLLVAAVSSASAYYSARGLRRAFVMAGLPADEPLVGHRFADSRRAGVAAVVALGLLLGFLGARMDGDLRPHREKVAGDAAALASSDRDGERARVGGFGSGGFGALDPAPDVRLPDGSGGPGTGDDDDDGAGTDATVPPTGDDNDDDGTSTTTTPPPGDDDDDDGELRTDDEVCDALDHVEETTDVDDLVTDTIDELTDEACDALDETTDDMCGEAGDVCDTVDDTVDDVQDTVGGTVSTVATTVTTVADTVDDATPGSDNPVGDLVDDLLGGLL